MMKMVIYQFKKGLIFVNFLRQKPKPKQLNQMIDLIYTFKVSKK